LVNATGGEGYYTWLAADACIYEHPPQIHLYGYDPLHLKLFLGKKVITWWYGYQVPGWESLSPEDLKSAFCGLIDYTLLYSLKTGSYPAPTYVLGVPKMVSYMPVLVDLNSNLGWEAAPGFVADGSLWVSRYGKGVGSCLVLGNCNLEDVKTEIKVLNEYLGSGTYVVAKYEGGKIENKIGGNITTISEVVPARNPLILRTVGMFDKGDSLKIEASFSLPRGESGRLEFKIISPDARDVEISLWVPVDRISGALVFDGKELKYVQQEGQVITRLNLSKGEHNLVLYLKPKIVIDSRQTVKDYQFFENKKPKVKILLGEKATEEEKLYASWLNNYFDTYYKFVLKDTLAENIKVVHDREAESSYIILGLPETNPFINSLSHGQEGLIKVEGKDMIVAGSSLPFLKKTVYSLLEILDEKYVFYGYFTGRYDVLEYINGNSPIAQKLGIEKSFLPYFK